MALASQRRLHSAGIRCIPRFDPAETPHRFCNGFLRLKTKGHLLEAIDPCSHGHFSHLHPLLRRGNAASRQRPLASLSFSGGFSSSGIPMGSPFRYLPNRAGSLFSGCNGIDDKCRSGDNVSARKDPFDIRRSCHPGSISTVPLFCTAKPPDLSRIRSGSPDRGAAITVSTDTVNSEPGAGTGRRRPLGMGVTEGHARCTRFLRAVRSQRGIVWAVSDSRS